MTRVVAQMRPAPPASSRPAPLTAFAVAVLPALGALVLYLFRIGTPALWLDEAATAGESGRSLSGLLGSSPSVTPDSAPTTCSCTAGRRSATVRPGCGSRRRSRWRSRSGCWPTWDGGGGGAVLGSPRVCCWLFRRWRRGTPRRRGPTRSPCWPRWPRPGACGGRPGRQSRHGRQGRRGVGGSRTPWRRPRSGSCTWSRWSSWSHTRCSCRQHPGELAGPGETIRSRPVRRDPVRREAGRRGGRTSSPPAPGWCCPPWSRWRRSVSGRRSPGSHPPAGPFCSTVSSRWPAAVRTSCCSAHWRWPVR